MNQIKYFSYMGFNWSIILMCLILVKFNIYFFPFCFLLISNRQFANYLVGHDGVHGLILKNRYWNDLVARLFCLGPVFVSLQSYKEKHLLHHEFLGTFADPDKKLYDFYPTSGNNFFKKIIGHFFSLSMLIDFLIYFTPLFEFNKGHFYRKEKMIDFLFYVLIAIGFSTGLILYFGIWIYITLWLLPLLMLMPYYYFVSALQHGTIFEKDDLEASRNIRGHWLLMELLLPCSTNYHGVHHLYPNISCFDLGRVFKNKNFPSLSYQETLKALLVHEE